MPQSDEMDSFFDKFFVSIDCEQGSVFFDVLNVTHILLIVLMWHKNVITIFNLIWELYYILQDFVTFYWSVSHHKGLYHILQWPIEW